MRNRITITLCLLFIFILQNKMKGQCQSFPIIYNSITLNAKYLIEKNKDYYVPKIKYIGVFKDSIYVGVGSQISEQLRSRRISPELFNRYNNLKSAVGRISIKLCDSNIIKSMNMNNFETSDPIEGRELGFYYPVMVTNIDTVPINIADGVGRDAVMPLKIEVLQKDKTWKQFMKASYWGCMTDLKEYYINPSEIVIVIIPIFGVNENCKLRVRKMENYSNIVEQNTRKLKQN